MFKLAYAQKILEAKKLKNAELHVDIENSSDYSPAENLKNRQNNWGYIKEGSFLKQRHVVRLGCMVLRIDKKGVSEKEVFMYVKPSTFVEDSWWSFKPRIILDYDTYSHLKGHPAQKLWPSLKKAEVSQTTKLDMTSNEKKIIGSSYDQNEEFAVEERDEIKDHNACLNNCFKKDIISLDKIHVPPKQSHSYEEFGTRGMVKATVQTYLSNTNIGTVTKHKPIESPPKLEKYNVKTENTISRKRSYVKEKIACFEEAAILKTTPEKLSEI